MNYTFPTGFHSDPVRVRESIQERTDAGERVMASAYMATKPDLRGTWKRMVARGITGIFLRDRELIILGGKYRRPYMQRIGTCVARAFGRAGQTSLDVAIADNLELMRPVEISFAPVYSLARVEVGRNRVGYQDGAIMADAAAAVAKYGYATTADIMPGKTEDQIEQAAAYYATPGRSTPAEWIAACRGNVSETAWPETLEDVFDFIAAGYAVAYAHGYVTGWPNAKGISDLGGYGNHARYFSGVFLDENGDTQLVSTESWGSFPARQPTNTDQTAPVETLPRIKLRYAGGEKMLAPGDVGVNAVRFWGQIRQGGEAWAVSPPSFLAGTVGDMLKFGRSLA